MPAAVGGALAELVAAELCLGTTGPASLAILRYSRRHELPEGCSILSPNARACSDRLGTEPGRALQSMRVLWRSSPDRALPGAAAPLAWCMGARKWVRGESGSQSGAAVVQSPPAGLPGLRPNVWRRGQPAATDSAAQSAHGPSAAPADRQGSAAQPPAKRQRTAAPSADKAAARTSQASRPAALHRQGSNGLPEAQRRKPGEPSAGRAQPSAGQQQAGSGSRSQDAARLQAQQQALEHKIQQQQVRARPEGRAAARRAPTLRRLQALLRAKLAGANTDEAARQQQKAKAKARLDAGFAKARTSSWLCRQKPPGTLLTCAAPTGVPRSPAGGGSRRGSQHPAQASTAGRCARGAYLTCLSKRLQSCLHQISLNGTCSLAGHQPPCCRVSHPSTGRLCPWRSV